MRWLHAYRIHLALFVVGLIGYGALIGDRLWKQSSDPHFVYQADAWLRGQLAITPPPTKGDDWAKVETVVLRDGRQVRGRRLQTRPVFRTLDGQAVPVADIASSRGVTHYVSFPPLPAAIMIPAAGQSERTVGDDLWLTLTLAFGTVLYFSAVQGRVWFTAHVVGVLLALGYAWASIEARRPLLAGLCLGLAAITRTPMAFMFPLFVLEAARVAGGLGALRAPAAERAAFLRRVAPPLLRFAAPVVIIAVAAAAYNLARFGEATEFGHSYLHVRQQAQIEAHGLFSYQYLARNLAVAFTLLPELPDKGPFVQISGHGLALWVTTPAFLLLLWPRTRPPLHRALWLTVALVAIPTFFYQNSGWVQFGYRFSLDYTPFLVLLLAVGGRRLGPVTRGLLVLGIVINLFGAWSFLGHPEYYRLGGAAYGTVVAH